MNEEPTPQQPPQQTAQVQPALAPPPAEALPLLHQATTTGEGRAPAAVAQPTIVAVPLAAPTAAPLHSRQEFLWSVHAYINEYIRFADSKAGFCVALDAAVMGALYTAGTHTQFMTAPPLQWTLLAWISFAAFAALFASIVLAVSAVRPRLWIQSTKGLIFWDSITKHGNPDAFTNAVVSEPVPELDTHLAHHLYSLSTVCRRKYKYVNVSIVTGVLGGILGAIALLFRS